MCQRLSRALSKRHGEHRALRATPDYCQPNQKEAEVDPAVGADRPVDEVLRAPVAGSVLRVHHKSAGQVSPGQPLLELGNVDNLEVRVNVLSQDAVRIMPGTRVLFEQWGGEATLEVLREADAIFIEELRANDLYDEVWQAFAVLLPVQSVGVMGDERTYENVCALRAVTSVDGMTADWAHLPHDFLGHVSNRIVNEVRGINRTVYDVSSKPPATIEWE